MKHPATLGTALLAVLVAFPTLLGAQETRTVTGHVTAEGASQAPVGVQVQVKGTNLGTLTDQKGDFTLSVPSSATTLVFTYIGYKTQEVPIQNHVEVTLHEEAIGLQGLVVTALGVRREKKTLGYSVEDVSGSDVSAVPTPNVINTLQGQVAGVHITNAGVTGGSSRIVIRGESSITGNNQPLIIVDGVPVNNSQAGTRPDGNNIVNNYSGIDWGNALDDLDPNNIQSVSVLKGPNAAALYGSRAANGAIVITTKSAQPGANYGVTATTSLTFQSPLKLPDYQNSYGQGWYGQFQFVDGTGQVGVWDGVDESWGPALNGQLIDQFTGKQMPFLPHPNNVRDYWKEGSNWTTNVAVARATENSNVRLSITHGDIMSMAPGYSIRRNSVELKGGAAITDKLHTKAEITYMEENDANRTGTGYNEANPMQGFTWFGRQVDLNALRGYVCNGTEPTPCVLGQEYNWNYNYHDNPFWMQFVDGSSAQRNRDIGSVSADYQVNDWISVTGAVNRDWYRWQQHQQNEIGTVGAQWPVKGGFSDNNIYRNETNYSLMATASRQLTSSILMDANAGANTRKDDFVNGNVDVYGLTVPGIYNVSNASGTPTTTDYQSHKEVRSVYGSLSLNYKGWWNVDLTGRNDWSSTLPPGKQSYFYPSVSSAFLFTDALGMNSSLLSSGKIRASWTRVGNDTDPYQLAATLGSLQPWGGSAPMFYIPNRLPNQNLKPEQTTAWELGTDLGFFNERAGFVLTYYNNTTRDQIMPVDVSAPSGYTSEMLNAGQVTNKGWELLLRATPLELDNGFRWDMTVNWSKNDSKVDQLYGDLQTLVLGGQWSLDIQARKGYPYGAMFANNTLTCDNAQIQAGDCTDAQKGLTMLGSNGLPLINPVRTVVGNYNPKWNGGIQNRFSYGPWDLSVLVDGQDGGNIFSVTNWFGTQAGVLASTLNGRTVSESDPGLVVKGVLPKGTLMPDSTKLTEPTVNGGSAGTIAVTSMDYYHNWWGNQAQAVVDASYVKLRQVRLGYKLPQSVMNRLGFSSGDIALVGRNLLLWTKAPNIDPETAYDASNIQGIESGQFPSARSYGFSLSIRP